MRTVLTILACITVYLAPAATHADTAVERQIRDLHPCAGFVIGEAKLNRERKVRVRSVSLTIRNDRFELSLDGALECQSPASAAIQTHIAANVALTAEGTFRDCSAARARIAFSKMEIFGFIRGLPAGAASGLEDSLSQQATRELIARCNDFAGNS